MTTSPASDDAVRAAAVEIAHYIDSTTPLSVGGAVIRMFEHIISKHVQPAGVTDAIEEVKRLRDSVERLLLSGGTQTNRIELEVYNNLLERLSALQAKAGGSEPDLCLAKHGGHYCKDQQGHIGKHLTCCTDEYFAATTAVGEAGTAFTPKHLGFPPAQQSPRVCVKCGHQPCMCSPSPPLGPD